MKNFISELKNYKYLEKYLWIYGYFIKSNDKKKIVNFPKIDNSYIIENYDGPIILGQYSHEYNNINYNENILYSVYASPKNIELSWDLLMDKLYYLYNKENYFMEDIQVHLQINMNYIVSSHQFYESIKNNFFNEYFYYNICKENPAMNGIFEHDVIFCNKEKFGINEIKKFPYLFFFIEILILLLI